MNPSRPFILRPVATSLLMVAILLAGDGQAKGTGTLQVTTPTETATLIDQLRASGVILIYDPDTRALRTDGTDAVAVSVSQNY